MSRLILHQYKVLGPQGFVVIAQAIFINGKFMFIAQSTNFPAVSYGCGTTTAVFPTMDGVGRFVEALREYLYRVFKEDLDEQMVFN